MSALRTKIDAVLGTVPADIVIKNIQILDFNTGGLTKSDIAISGNTIVGAYVTYRGKKEIGGKNQISGPGLGLTSGAMASSVAHDSHNICVTGTNGGGK